VTLPPVEANLPPSLKLRHRQVHDPFQAQGAERLGDDEAVAAFVFEHFLHMIRDLRGISHEAPA